ncbi:MAG: hypothetical protein ACE5FN_00730 [Leptospirillia bacterium]
MRARVTVRHFACVLFSGALLTSALSACASLSLRPADPAEADRITKAFADRRSGIVSANALAQVEVDGADRRGLLPSFTAVIRYRAPDRIILSGYDAVGAPLFHYTSMGGNHHIEITGGNPDAVPAALLKSLPHLLDGLLGPTLEGRPLFRDRKSRWVSGKDADGIRFTVDGGHLHQLFLKRVGRDVSLVFSDYRDGPEGAPYRIVLTAPKTRIRLMVSVDEWVLERQPLGVSETALTP